MSLAVSLSIPGSAQSGFLTLEDLYKNNTYAVKDYGPARWLADGSGYTTLETAASVRDVSEIRTGIDFS